MSSSEGLKECCVSGHVHEGEPKGKVDKVYGLDTYVTGESNAEKTVILITDVFGYSLKVCWSIQCSMTPC